MTSASDYALQVVDPRTLSDRELTDEIDLLNLVRAEILPDEPPEPAALWISSAKTLPRHYGAWHLRVLSPAGQLVSDSVAVKDFEDDPNPDLTFLSVRVHPEHRRRGVATLQLAHHVGLAQALGRTRFVCTVPDLRPESAKIVARLGGEIKSRAHTNELAIADADRDLLESWVREAASRASDYELLHLDQWVPDDLVEDYVALFTVMNSAPRDDLEVNDFTLTVEQHRESETRMAQMGIDQWLVVARHVPTGQLVGLHNLFTAPGRADRMDVGVTGVVPEHRGSGLGKWLKAVLMLRVLDERPEVTAVRTGNADSNAAMLGINQAMGYRPVHGNATWEIPRAAVGQWLAERGIAVPDLREVVEAQWALAP